MIDLNSWTIEEESKSDFLDLRNRYDYCFLGSDLSLDDRLKWIGRQVNTDPSKIVYVNYNHDTSTIHLSNSTTGINVGKLNSFSPPKGGILIDATSLLLPELIYLMEWSNLHDKHFDVIYVEPSEYSSKSYQTKIGMQSIDYSLSEDGPGINMLPRFTSPLDDSHLTVALGYEGHRFGALLISDEITPRAITGIVGVPPFVLGWEKTTFSKNHCEMRDAKKHYDADFKVIPANDPLQAYNAISTIHKAISAETRKGRARLHLAPIGTKPIALAMSWFAINHRGTGILYDFVKKKAERSKGIGRIHLWEFNCS